MRTNLPPERARDDLPPKAQRLRDIGRQALGDGWQYRLAQAENVGVKTVQRWASGERECPDHILVAVESMLAEWRKSGLARLLRDVEGEAERSPAFAIVASAHLADLAQRIKPASEVPKDRRYKPKTSEPRGS